MGEDVARTFRFSKKRVLEGSVHPELQHISWSRRVWDWVYGAAAATCTGWALARRAGYPSSSELLGEQWYIPAAAIAVGAATFLVHRCLPDLSDPLLREAEARILETIKAPFTHEWTEYKGPSGFWRIHSIHFRSPAVREHHVPRTPGSGPRPNVVLLHGHSGGCAHWECIFDRVAEIADFHVLDMPGWGRSPAPKALQDVHDPDSVVELHMEMIRGWLETHRLENVVLVGHSLGAMMASHFSARYPQCVRHVILADIAGLTPAVARENIGWTFMMRFLSPQMFARVMGRWGFVLFRAVYNAITDEDPRYPDYYYQLAAATEYHGYSDRIFRHFVRFSRDFSHLWWTRPVLDVVLHIPLPISVIWGENDDLFPSDQAHLLHRLRPDVDVYIIRRGLHNPAHTNAEAFADAMERALRAHQWAVNSPVAMDSNCHPSEEVGVEDASAKWAQFRRSAQSTSNLEISRRRASDVPPTGPGTSQPGHRRLPRSSSATSLLPQQHSLLPLKEDDEPPRPAPGELELAGEPLLPGLPRPPPLHTRSRRGRSPFRLPELPAAGAGAGGGRGGGGGGGGGGVEEGEDMAAPSTGASPPAVTRTLPRTLTPTRLASATRGICHSCGGHVTLYKSYWRCLCGAWSFAVPTNPADRGSEMERMEAFLEDLHVRGTFAARGNPHIRQFLSVRSAVPTEVLHGNPRKPALENLRRRLRASRLRAERTAHAVPAETGGTGSQDQQDPSEDSAAQPALVQERGDATAPPGAESEPLLSPISARLPHGHVEYLG